MSRVETAMAWAERRGRDRGIRGASSIWLGVWVLATGYRWIRRIAREDPVVVREVLRPGEQLVISHFPEGAAVDPDPGAGHRRRRRR